MEEQTRSVKASAEEMELKEDTCPECGTQIRYAEGCFLCPTCGYSKCG